MRLSTEPTATRARAEQTVAAALQAGVTVFDTAHAYGLDEHELGHNERLLARALSRAAEPTARRIVTKGGMARAGGAWVPDGRAKAIRADCEASLTALDGLPIDLYLIHAPDLRTPWRTSLRALQELLDDGLVERVGISNVNLPQLDEALSSSRLRQSGRTQRVRRPSRAWRRAGTVRRARDRGDRPLAAGRPAPAALAAAA